MHAIDWDDVRHFLEVVHSGSVTQAATRLGVNYTTVSRRITALERRLGKGLFERSSNGWVITPVGERIVTAAESMAEEANTIKRQVLADSHELTGVLRVTSADLCVQQMMMPAIKKFIARYPDVELEIIATVEPLDLAAREADVALRATDEPPPNLVGKRIADIAYAIYGIPELKSKVEQNPNAPDIPCLTWVGDGTTRPPWIEKSFPNARRIYRCTALSIMLEMARQGMGIAQLPCSLGDTEPNLERIPARYVEPGWGLWVLSHVDLRTTARVRIFRDFLVKELEKQKDLIEGRKSN
ncbi:MAG: LysR family transcriptional regulator [Pseudomonadota bacterium]